MYGCYGCHSNKEIALIRAITELVQSISALSDNGDLKQLNKQRSKAKTVLDEDKNFNIYVNNLPVTENNSVVPGVRVIISGM